MKSIQLPAYTLNIVRAVKSMSIQEREVGTPAEDEVLIKVIAAPINPSDISFVQGRYGVKKPLPANPGFEGCGVVLESGNSTEAKALQGKRISCFSQSDNYGTWSEMLIVRASDCIEIIDELPDEQAACLSVNPFTAFAMYQLAKEKNAKAILLNAAGSQVARFIQDLSKRDGIETINIVRKDETVDLLKAKGVSNIINQQDENFEDVLKQICIDKKAEIAFDAVGGEMTGLLYNSLDKGASVFVYGGLSGKSISNINILEVIFNNKTLSGFDLNQWLKQKSKDEFKSISLEIQNLIKDKVLETEINEIFSLENFEKALFAYIKNMSAGKVLLKP